jgi:transcriptional repressor NrdR
LIAATFLLPNGGTEKYGTLTILPAASWCNGKKHIDFSVVWRRKTMKCPYCGYAESKVIDSRPAEEGSTIRRRRECLACSKRFTTYEIMERLPLVVVKRDGSRQSFDRVKVINGLVRACEKRPVALSQLEAIADEIESELQGALEREISTTEIGEMVMERLKGLDEVAYVRFASVYRQFKDINTFMEELTKLLGDKSRG